MDRLVGILLALACTGLGGSCSASGSIPQSTSSSSTFSNEMVWNELTIGPNDRVRVSVYGHPDLGTPLGPGLDGTRVDNEGLLSLPLVGPVQIGGQSVKDAREAITQAIAEYVQDPRVDFSVIEYAARRVYIYGEVNKPGAYVLDRPLNVYQALTLGGGFTPRARRDQIVVLRGQPDALEVRVVDGDTPNLDGLVALRPDDFLFVRRSGAGKFSDEVLPFLTGVSAALGTAATLLVLDDELH